MIVKVTNLTDFWEAVDDTENNLYSLVIEGSDEQCVLYVYDIGNKKVLSALLVPPKIKCPISIEITWRSCIVYIKIQQQFSANYDVNNLLGQSEFGEWINS